jgi:hypothetical protein
MRKISTSTALAALIVAALLGIYQARTNNHVGPGAAVAAVSIIPGPILKDVNKLASEKWDAF